MGGKGPVSSDADRVRLIVLTLMIHRANASLGKTWEQALLKQTGTGGRPLASSNGCMGILYYTLPAVSSDALKRTTPLWGPPRVAEGFTFCLRRWHSAHDSAPAAFEAMPSFSVIELCLVCSTDGWYKTVCIRWGDYRVPG
jgi:hypothetical protein